jgi:F-type H+-transporting ATPase subunit a
MDQKEFHLFDSLGGGISIPLPKLNLFGYEFQITKFMVLSVIAAGLIALIYIPIARRVKDGSPPKGFFWNCFESILTFLRDQVAKPYIGKDADRYVPFLWTLFLFILFCNLLGMIPFLGSPTGSLSVTATLAILAFLMIHGSAIMKQGREDTHGHDHGHGHDEHAHEHDNAADKGHDHGHDHGHGHESGHVHVQPGSGAAAVAPVNPLVAFGRGFVRYVKAHAPHTGMPFWPSLPLVILIMVIEFLGHFIKAFVLAVRLFANMFAGHTVLAFIMFFIVMARDAHPVLWGSITVVSVVGSAALSLLELFVAFLQAFIFTFLTALFLGMSLNPEH